MNELSGENATKNLTLFNLFILNSSDCYVFSGLTEVGV